METELFGKYVFVTRLHARRRAEWAVGFRKASEVRAGLEEATTGCGGEQAGGRQR